MSAIPKSDLKRIRDILLAEENGISNDVNDNQGSNSDSDSDFLATESDDTSNSEHISEESDLSDSDFEHGDVVTVSQPETLKKNGVTWSIYPSLEQSRTAAANLIDRLPNNVKQGRCITFDRYFTDIKLFDALLDRKMTSIGVVEHRRSFLTDELKLYRRNLYSTWFYFSGQNMVLSYQAKEKKKPIIILSSSHNQPEVFDDDKKLPCACSS
ncbi:unnamed protein product [Rotaria magnacalcarata]|uniref:PiggyBac transposable element-derived protein domain-containing protein n=3 Tax=Rotaria magnacalcarata TaxID=392030 RepID=A0A815LRI0_9BILA|nr:unnamed protein product [Rotaria magnacalcarata]